VAKKLVVSDGTRERELLLVGRIVVGRDPICDITYDDALLSRQHAEFVAAGDQVTVRDLGSRNGVFVNGAKIAERRLHSGDIVQIGPVRARYVSDKTPVSIAPDEVDKDHTAVMQSAPRAEAPAPAPAPPVAAAKPPTVRPTPVPPPVADDEDRTRMIPAPRSLQTADSAVSGSRPGSSAVSGSRPGSVSGSRPGTTPPPVDEDNEKTQFLQAPRSTSGSGVRSRPPTSPGFRVPDDDGTSVLSRPLPDDDEATSVVLAPRQPDDDDATSVVLAPPRPPPSPEPPPLPVETAAAPQEIAPAPRDIAPIPPAPSPIAAPPLAAAPAIGVAVAAAAPQTTVVRSAPPSLSTFVFVQALVLAAIVLLATAVPFVLWRSPSSAATGGESSLLMWLALAAAVALVAAYGVSVLINRRFVETLTALERDRT